MYKSLEDKIRDLMEKTSPINKDRSTMEFDPNDQIQVGTYKTKNFEVSRDAQKLLSQGIPKDSDEISAEQMAIYHDKLFDLVKQAMVKKRTTKDDVNAAEDHIDKIKNLAKNVGIGDKINYLDQHLEKIKKHVDDDTSNTVDSNVLDKDELEKRFTSKPTKYSQEPRDFDVDNTKVFAKRSIAAQRKLKIIDDEYRQTQLSGDLSEMNNNKIGEKYGLSAALLEAAKKVMSKKCECCGKSEKECECNEMKEASDLQKRSERAIARQKENKIRRESSSRLKEVLRDAKAKAGMKEEAEQMDESQAQIWRDKASAHLHKQGIGSHWKSSTVLMVHDKHVDSVQDLMDKKTGGRIHVVGHTDEISPEQLRHMTRKEEFEQIDEQLTHTAYLKPKDNAPDEVKDHFEIGVSSPDPRAAHKKFTEVFGRSIAKHYQVVHVKPRGMKEEAEQIDELDRQIGSHLNRYIRAATDDFGPRKGREQGVALALKKKWGDKKFGLDEPKVKAVDRIRKEEAEQIDERNKENKRTKDAFVAMMGLPRSSYGHSASMRLAGREYMKSKEKLTASPTQEILKTKIKTRLRKEEVEQIDEINAETRASWIKQTFANHFDHYNDKTKQIEKPLKGPMPASRVKVYKKATKDADKINMKKYEDEKRQKRAAREPQVHDLRHMSHGEAYDETQTNEKIKDGDVLRVKNGTAVMVGAWPTMIHGKSDVLHRFNDNTTIHTYDNGSYHKTAKLADKVHGLKEEVEQIDEGPRSDLRRKLTSIGYGMDKATGKQRKKGWPFSKGDAAEKLARVTRKTKMTDDEIQQHLDIAKKVRKEETEQVLSQKEIENLEQIWSTLEEGRGRPPKEGSEAWHRRQKELEQGGTGEDEADTHIMVQVKKAADQDEEAKKPFMITYHKSRDPKTGKAPQHPLPRHHAQKIWDKYSKLKPTEKEAFQNRVEKSHAALMAEL